MPPVSSAAGSATVTQCANPVYLQICKAWMETARERNSKGFNTYKRAYESMKACPTTFSHPSQAGQLKGFGPVMCKRLTEEYSKYCTENGLEPPVLPEPVRGQKRGNTGTSGEAADEGATEPAAPPKKPRKQKAYCPGYRTGGYALLIAMYELEQEQGEDAIMTKAELVLRAQKWCDSSFVAPSDPGKSYTAWAAMKLLVEKYDLVWQRGNPKKYSLTEVGREVAKGIMAVENGEVVTGPAGGEKEKAKGKGRGKKKGAVSEDEEEDGRDSDRVVPAKKRAPVKPRVGATAKSTATASKTGSSNLRKKKDPTPVIITSPPSSPPPPPPPAHPLRNRLSNIRDTEVDKYDTTIEFDDDFFDTIDNFQPAPPAKSPIRSAEVSRQMQKISQPETILKENDVDTVRRLRLEAINRRLCQANGPDNSVYNTNDSQEDRFLDLTMDVDDDDDFRHIVPSSPPEITPREPLRQKSHATNLPSTINPPSRPTAKSGPTTVPNTLTVENQPTLPTVSGESSSGATFPAFTPVPFLPGTYTIHLILDTREVRTKSDRDYLQRSLQALDIPVITRPLHLGDALWIARETATGRELVLDWILERKRMDDLVGSIKDGRFHEQKFRLARCGIKNVVYLVEEFGSFDPATGATTSVSATTGGSYGGGDSLQQAIQTALSSTQVINNFFVKRTMKVDDTIRYLARMTLYITKLYNPGTTLGTGLQNGITIYPIPPTLIDSQTYTSGLLPHLARTYPEHKFYPDYDDWNALVDKSASMLLRDVFVKMLMCTRGLSAEKAVEVMKIWKTPRGFVEAFQGGEGGGKEVVEKGMNDAGVFGRKKVTGKLAEKVAEVWGK